MALLTYLGTRRENPKTDYTEPQLEHATHNGRLVFPEGVPVEVPARLAAVLLSSTPEKDAYPVVGTKRGRPAFELTVSQEELDMLLGVTACPGTPNGRSEWGDEGDWRSAYDNIIAKHPQHLKVTTATVEAAEVDAKPAKAK